MSTVIWQVAVMVRMTKCAPCLCWCGWRTVIERPKMKFSQRSSAFIRPSPPPEDRAAESKSHSNGGDWWTDASTAAWRRLEQPLDYASMVA